MAEADSLASSRSRSSSEAPGDKGRMPEGHQEASKPSTHSMSSDAENRLSGAFMDDLGGQIMRVMGPG